MKKRVTFKITGADLAVVLFQVMSMIMGLYILVIPGYYYLITNRNIFTFLFDLSASCLPRAEYWLLSLIYRMTLNEIIVFFCICVTALAFGLVMKKLLRLTGKAKVIVRIIYLIWIVLDVFIRILPLSINHYPQKSFQIVGIIFRAVLFVLIFSDLINNDNVIGKNE